jgi:predicted Co/Zn/Cd cation transporter (cation efflux family)
MSTALGLVLFVVFILAVIAAAAAITWVVVRVSPSRKADRKAS